MSKYVLDNAAAETEQRFASLESCYDPGTIRQFEQIGVTPGWSCLEVGGGGGSIARWLADCVGPDGKVVVTDINPQWIERTPPNIETRVHDIVSDDLEQAAFDLIHERLVLIHLPERDPALRRMTAALKPGGWILIEDFDITWLPLTPNCEAADAALFTKVIDAFHHLLHNAGVDLAYGRNFHPLLHRAGLIDVHVEVSFEVGTGGSAGCRLHHANIEQLHDRLTEQHLLTVEEIERFHTLIDDPAFSCNNYAMVSARGRRPPR
jgi:SAM-dependent methyltransferase